MAEVWAAWHTTLRREVALKVVRTDEELLLDRARRFEREVEALARLRHPNTVRVFDFGSEPGGLLYYAMELLEGEHVGSLVRREGPLSEGRARHIALQAARALAEAHDQGIVHRDVKPENLFITTAGAEGDLVKVLDFGIAYVMVPMLERLTHDDVIAGTPATMSPEILRGEPPTAASDVYALGCVLYFMVTGSMPFSSAKNVHVFEAHLRQAPIPPSTVRGAPLPEALERMILRCLEKEPGARPGCGREVVFELAAIGETRVTVE
jgi:serine/threonine-protein kinase